MFPISTFSTLATITMSVCGLVTEKMACVDARHVKPPGQTDGRTRGRIYLLGEA